MAFGKLGLDKETFWSMTLKEFFNAWIGWQETQRQQFETQRNLLFSSARYLAANSAWSKEAGQKIARSKFPWERTAGKKVSIHDKLASFVRRQEIIQKNRDGRA